MVVIEMENGGVIKIELNREAAPKTVENFEKLHLKSQNSIIMNSILDSIFVQTCSV